ncbi:MAG: response regulator transcription factor [bacterium]|jgi:DNA-binding response OmpR family regulator
MGLSLLVVEDEYNIKNAIIESINTFIVPKFKINLISADNFSQAKELINKNKIDISLLDYILPDGDGIELLKIIKELNPSSIVIFLTAVEEYKLIALNLGADDYILKPFNLAEIIAKLTNWIKRIESNYKSELIHLFKDYYYDKTNASLLISQGNYYKLIDTLSYEESILFETLLNNLNNFVTLNDKSIENYTIYTLRKKLEKLGFKLITLKGGKLKLKID